MSEEITGTAPEEVSVWEDFVDIFHAPSEVFARRRTAGFWLPLLIVAFITTILSFGTARILEPVFDADAQRQTQAMAEKNPELDASGARAMMGSFRTFLSLTAGIVVIVIIVIQGWLLWIGGKVAGSDLSGRAGILITTYAAIPRLLEGVVATLEGLLRGPSNLDSMTRLSWSPARFLDPDTASPLITFLASRLDLFTVWWLVLLVIGLSVIGRMPRDRAAVVAAALWLVLSLPGLVGALTA